MTPGYRFGVPPSGGGAPAKTMITITFNTLDNANVPPAKAGTPYRFGVPPSGGQAHANTLTAKTCDAIENANTRPAKAGTPNRLALHGVPASAGEAQIQPGMEELEGVLK